MSRALACLIGAVLATSCGRDRPVTFDSTAMTTGVPEPLPSLDTTLTWQSMRFRVVAHGGDLVIQPAGYSIDNRRVQLSLASTVVGVEVGDLNGDNWPELLVYLASEEPDRHGDVIGFSSNAGKSMSQIYFPPLAGTPRAHSGYSGHDDFVIDQGALVQMFPITEDGMATSKIRRIRYKLVDGESARTLQIEGISDYQQLPPLPAALAEFARKHGDTVLPEYRHALLDLDGDRRDDAVVMLLGPAWCGDGGCQMLVLRGDRNRFEFVSASTVASEPVRVLDRPTRGWKTLIAHSKGRGDVLLPFDGKGYPADASLQPKAARSQLSAARILLQ
ncbi:MAG: hypothetical protein ACRENU_00675 [Gemmatimonadaceae bacterium]